MGISSSRIRLTAVAFGCAFLGVSFFDWSQNLTATESGYKWVEAKTSSVPAVETSEIWEIFRELYSAIFRQSGAAVQTQA